MNTQARTASARDMMAGALTTAAAALTMMATFYATTARADTVANNKAVIQKSFDDWAAGTGGPYSLLREDATWEITGRSAAAKVYPNREAFMREVIRPFNARMQSPLKPVIRGLYGEGDTVIVLFNAAGTARDGKPYVNTYSWYLHMADGQIASATAFFDAIAFDDLWSRVTPE